jgi:hypothetical protein
MQLECLLKECFASGSGQYGEKTALGLGIRVEKISMSEPIFSHSTAIVSPAAEIDDNNLSSSLSDVVVRTGPVSYGK